MTKSLKLTSAALLVLALSACGSNPGDRIISGAGIGAGVGATVGWLTGLGPGIGAAIGAGVGGAVGGVTDQNDLDLGQPWWRQ